MSTHFFFAECRASQSLAASSRTSDAVLSWPTAATLSVLAYNLMHGINAAAPGAPHACGNVAQTGGPPEAPPPAPSPPSCLSLACLAAATVRGIDTVTVFQTISCSIA